jgi:hypothetical protein
VTGWSPKPKEGRAWPTIAAEVRLIAWTLSLEVVVDGRPIPGRAAASAAQPSGRNDRQDGKSKTTISADLAI